MKFIIFIMIIILTSCADVSDVFVFGKVVDSETGKPIGDVLVYAEWKSYHYGFEHSWTKCEKVEISKTDSGGRYGFAGVNATVGILENVPRIDEGMLLVYKKGYRAENLSSFSSNGRVWIKDIKDMTIKLVPDSESGRNRINYLNTLASDSTCMQSYREKYKYKKIAKEYISSIYSELHQYLYTKNDVKCSFKLLLQIG